MKETLWLPWWSKPVRARKRWAASVRVGTYFPSPLLNHRVISFWYAESPEEMQRRKWISQLHCLQARGTPCFGDKTATLVPTVQAREPTQIMLGIQWTNGPQRSCGHFFLYCPLRLPFCLVVRLLAFAQVMRGGNKKPTFWFWAASV